MWYSVTKLLTPSQSLLQVPALTHREAAGGEKVPASSLAPLPVGRRAGAETGWQDLPWGEEPGEVDVGGFGATALLEECGARQFTAKLQALQSSCCGHKLCLPGDFHTFHQRVFHLALGASGQRC